MSAAALSIQAKSMDRSVHAAALWNVRRQSSWKTMRLRRLLKSKIHRATVTEANVDYDGSITIDQSLMTAADLAPYEAVHVWNVTRGTRFETYAIPAPSGSGVICINGAAAHRASAGELVIIASFTDLPEDEVPAHEPRLVFVDEENRIRRRSPPVVR